MKTLDLFILLLYYAQTNTKPLYLRKDYITEYKQIHGHDLFEQLHFIHAFSRCDTSSVFGIGKGIAFKKLIGNKQFNRISPPFTSFDTSKEEIEQAGEKAMFILYDGDINNNK